MFPTVYFFLQKENQYIIVVCRKKERNINLWHKPLVVLIFSKAAIGTVGTAYAFQEHMKEEMEFVFMLKIVSEKEFKGETGGTCHGT